MNNPDANLINDSRGHITLLQMIDESNASATSNKADPDAMQIDRVDDLKNADAQSDAPMNTLRKNLINSEQTNPDSSFSIQV